MNMHEIVERWFWNPPPPPYEPSDIGFEMWCYDQLPPHLREAEACGGRVNYEAPRNPQPSGQALAGRPPRTLVFDMERPMTMLDRASLLATIPSLFAGDDRKVLEDWINNAPPAKMSAKSEQMSRELVTHPDPVTATCGHIMLAGTAKVLFDAMQAAKAAGISGRDIEVGMIRWIFGNVHSSLKVRNASLEERILLSAELLEECDDNCTKLAISGVL